MNTPNQITTLSNLEQIAESSSIPFHLVYTYLDVCEEYRHYWRASTQLGDSSEVMLSISASDTAMDCITVIVNILNHESKDAISLYHNLNHGFIGLKRGLEQQIRVTDFRSTRKVDRYDLLTGLNPSFEHAVAVAPSLFGGEDIESDGQRSKFIEFMRKILPQFELGPQLIDHYHSRKREEKAFRNFLAKANEVYETGSILPPEPVSPLRALIRLPIEYLRGVKL